MPILVLILLLNCWIHQPNEKANLLIEFTNIQQAKGQIWLAIYDSPKHFLNKEYAVVLDKYEVVKKGSQIYEVKNLPHGTYAIAAFHDLNGNNELDQSLIGAPKEPYAFSQTLKSKWRAPKFEEVQFQFKATQQKVRLALEYW